MNASDILARQQLKEAWDTTLKQAGWAEQKIDERIVSGWTGTAA